ncbi:MAG: hypothetical protein J2P21_28100 [Chloracidobacterium sp.]|nr:hypothetical protein [Chloracidobacterium sp.]
MNDREITLLTPKETVRIILVERYEAAWNTGMPRLEEIKTRDEKIRTVIVLGQTLEREKRLRSNHTSIKERNCRRQIDKIGGDRMWNIFPYFMERLLISVVSLSGIGSIIGLGGTIIGLPIMLIFIGLAFYLLFQIKDRYVSV